MTNDDEVCIPCLSSILLAVHENGFAAQFDIVTGFFYDKISNVINLTQF